MKHSRFTRCTVLAMMASTFSLAVTTAPALYAAPTSVPQTEPYYQAGRQPLPAQSTMAPAVPAQQPYYNNYSADQNQPVYDVPATRPSPTLDQMVVDGLIMRPIMMVATVLGTGVFLATLPASALGGNVDAAARKLVVEPGEATFATCLGCIFERNQSRYESWH